MNDQKILIGRGSVSNSMMEKIVKEIYEVFNNRRQAFEAKTADENDLAELKIIEGKIKEK